MTDLPHILNWRRIDTRITTSGQPSEQQLAEIQRLGVSHIINLGPHHNKGALEDGAASVASLGMTYIYIPVDFKKPTDQDFHDFETAIRRLPAARIHVHCIYNARVSAFFYRLAKSGFAMSEAVAFKNMDGIWKPGEDWASFVGRADAAGQSNRYAGHDY